MKNAALKWLFLCLFTLVFTAATASAGDVNLPIAASLTDVGNELTDSFAKANPGVKFLKNYGASGLLAKGAKILFTVPQDLYPRVTYPMALTVTGAKNAEAVAFYRYLRSEASMAVLVKYGFSLK